MTSKGAGNMNDVRADTLPALLKRYIESHSPADSSSTRAMMPSHGNESGAPFTEKSKRNNFVKKVAKKFYKRGAEEMEPDRWLDQPRLRFLLFEIELQHETSSTEKKKKWVTLLRLDHFALSVGHSFHNHRRCARQRKVERDKNT